MDGGASSEGGSSVAQVTKIRWRWVGTCGLLGAALTLAAYYTEDRWGWEGVSPSLLVNAGTAVGLAGLLFLFERRFTTVVNQVVSRVAGQVTGQLEERTAGVERRLENLAEELAERRSETQQRRASVVADIGDVTFASVTGALELANEINALDGGVAIVQAAHDPLGVRLAFRWGRRRDDQAFDRRFFPPALTIEALPPFSLRDATSRAHVELEWSDGVDAADVGSALEKALMRASWWHGPETCDWALALGNLMRTLEVAIGSKSRAPGAWHLHGTVIELVGSDWVLTDQGIEAPDHGYWLQVGEFPEHDRFALPGGPRRAEFAPPRPEFATPEEWRRLVSEGLANLPRHGFFSMINDWWVPQRPAST